MTQLTILEAEANHLALDKLCQTLKHEPDRNHVLTLALYNLGLLEKVKSTTRGVTKGTDIVWYSPTVNTLDVPTIEKSTFHTLITPVRQLRAQYGSDIFDGRARYNVPYTHKPLRKKYQRILDELVEQNTTINAVEEVNKALDLAQERRDAYRKSMQQTPTPGWFISQKFK